MVGWPLVNGRPALVGGRHLDSSKGGEDSVTEQERISRETLIKRAAATAGAIYAAPTLVSSASGQVRVVQVETCMSSHNIGEVRDVYKCVANESECGVPDADERKDADAEWTDRAKAKCAEFHDCNDPNRPHCVLTAKPPTGTVTVEGDPQCPGQLACVLHLELKFPCQCHHCPQSSGSPAACKGKCKQGSGECDKCQSKGGADCRCIVKAGKKKGKCKVVSGCAPDSRCAPGIPCEGAFFCNDAGTCICFVPVPGDGSQKACVDFPSNFCSDYAPCNRADGSGCPPGSCCLDTCCPEGICSTPCSSSRAAPRMTGGRGPTLTL
jgi:hypothetical protein